MDHNNQTAATTSHARPDIVTPFVAPRNQIEQTVADFWQRLFGFSPIGVNDNFFDLGGTSVLALQLISQMRDAFQMELPLENFFETPTIARMAQVIEENQPQPDQLQEIARILADVEVLTPAQIREKYADELRAVKETPEP
jgi:acyl carrier protein